jgi:DNA-binding NarL/FixJ family response regulator
MAESGTGFRRAKMPGTSRQPMNILVVDDHPLYRSGVVHALHATLPDLQVTECSNVQGALAKLDEGGPVHLMILDLQMPGCTGLDSLRAVRAHRPDVPVLVLSGNESPAVVRDCVDLGAFGFVPKSAPGDMLPAALELVLSGGVFLPPSSLSIGEPATRAQKDAWDKLGARLTERQRQVLLGIVQGKPNKVIARDLNLSDATVKTHVSHIFDALVVSNRTEAVYALARAGVGINDLQVQDRPTA